MATAIALRRLEIEAEAKAEAEGGTSNFVSSIWYDVKAILVISMTSVVEYQSILGTLLLNEGIPRALKGKKLRLKNILLFPLIFEEINHF